MTLTTHDLQQIERALHLAWGKAIDAGDSATARIFYEACRLARKHAPQPTTPPADPMDWPLPCDVKVGHGTIGKGCSLRTLVTRMKVLYKMATGRDADAPVEPVTFADIDELAAKLARANKPPIYVGNGLFEGESLPQAAESWAQWCEARCIGGLPDVLRRLAAQTQGQQP